MDLHESVRITDRIAIIGKAINAMINLLGHDDINEPIDRIVIISAVRGHCRESDVSDVYHGTVYALKRQGYIVYNSRLQS